MNLEIFGRERLRLCNRNIIEGVLPNRSLEPKVLATRTHKLASRALGYTEALLPWFDFILRDAMVLLPTRQLAVEHERLARGQGSDKYLPVGFGVDGASFMDVVEIKHPSPASLHISVIETDDDTIAL